jgi:hypothetical protein
MMPSAGEYGARLVAEFGANLANCRSAIGHPGGVHEDNMYLIAKLSSLDEVHNVIEFGSGLSSLVLGKALEGTGVGFVSMEDWPHWADLANASLEKMGVSHRVISTECEPSRCPAFEHGFEVAFLDGNIFHPAKTAGLNPGRQVVPPLDLDNKYTGRGGALLYYEEQLKDAVLIWDDAESLVEYIDKFTAMVGRDPAELTWFNPTGRGSRHQRISLPEKNKEIYREAIRSIETL